MVVIQTFKIYCLHFSFKNKTKYFDGYRNYFNDDLVLSNLIKKNFRCM